MHFLRCPFNLPLYPDNKQAVNTLFQLLVYSDARYPHAGLLAGQRSSRKSSKLESATPEGIIFVLWYVEGKLFASYIVMSRAWESKSREWLFWLAMHSFFYLTQWCSIHTYPHTHTKPDQPASRSWDKLSKGQSVHKAECTQKIISGEACRSSSFDLTDKPLAVSTQPWPGKPSNACTSNAVRDSDSGFNK